MDNSTLTAAATVKRLTELGFTIIRTGLGMTLLGRGERRVLVPHVTIERPMLRAIVRSAGITEADFLRTVGRSGVYTKTTPVPGAGTRKTGE